MMRRILSFALALAAAQPALAQDETYAEVQGWSIGQHDASCAAYMQFEGPGETQFYLNKGADGGMFVMVLNSSWSASEGQDYQVTFDFPDRSYSGSAKGTRIDNAGGFGAAVPPAFETSFTTGTMLVVLLDDREIDRLSLRGTTAAMASVNRCLVGVRRNLAAAAREKARYADLPPDPFAPPRRINADPRPRGDKASWITNDDYPSRAAREQRQGRVGFTVGVDVTGRVSGCKVTASSGSPDLDSTTCAVVSRRARFDPGTDDQGNPRASSWSSTMIWSLNTP